MVDETSYIPREKKRVKYDSKDKGLEKRLWAWAGAGFVVIVLGGILESKLVGLTGGFMEIGVAAAYITNCRKY